MKRSLLSLLLLASPLTLAAQTLATGPARAAANNEVEIPVVLGASGAEVTVLQFDLRGTARILAVTAGPAAVTAAKTVAYNSETQRVVVAGLNRTAIPDGTVAVVRAVRSRVPVRGSARGVATSLLTLDRISACDKDGSPVLLHASGAAESK